MGNPNVGKSTVFNEITGSHQHTGNWTGKTVGVCKGRFEYKYNNYEIVDLPGTYSLLSSSEEERLARDYLCFEDYDCVVCVVDATNLERNLNLALQLTEVTDRVILLLNLCDEAKKKNIEIDDALLSKSLGVPVVRATARSGKGINGLLEKIHMISNSTEINEPHILYYTNTVEEEVRNVTKGLKSTIATDKSLRFLALRLLENDESFNSSFVEKFGRESLISGNLRGRLNSSLNRLKAYGVNISKTVTETIFKLSGEIAEQVSSELPSKKQRLENKLDNLLMGKYTAVPVMLLLLGIVLWITIAGSNYPSELLRSVFDDFENRLAVALMSCEAPQWLISLFVNGILRVLLWVVAVMLPPMAVFFPLFALLEDFGVLPRIAFNLDGAFERSHACGKQALTMCMGYGCNAVGVTGARIIDSPRERLLAIITNSLSPCNGRFPMLIAIISMFFTGNSLIGAMILLSMTAVSAAVTLASSRILSSTALKGIASTFVLELPPYRKPKLLKLLGDTIREKILFVLLRAVVVAAPAGFVIWAMANIKIGGTTLLNGAAVLLDPVGKFLGFDGVMLLAFILGFPANEIVIPIALMTYLSTGEISDYSSLEGLKEILLSNGWTSLTAVCVCMFSMFHFPCSTTLLTVYKETKSVKWTALSVAVPLVAGIVICSGINILFG